MKMHIYNTTIPLPSELIGKFLHYSLFFICITGYRSDNHNNNTLNIIDDLKYIIKYKNYKN